MEIQNNHKLNLNLYHDMNHNRPYIIRSHYGDDSIALVQWAYEQGLKPVEVVTINTGFAAEQWLKRQELGEAHAKTCGFKTTTIMSSITFEDAVKGRGEFPSPQFQWCSALLKGLPFLDWLDIVDPKAEAIILIAKRKMAAKAHHNLEEWIENCEFHQDRTVWHPLININTQERNAILSRAGFSPLNHRSLECGPCVNSSPEDIARLSQSDLKKIQELETTVGSSFFPTSSITSNTRPISELDTYMDLFYRGCGNHYGCGL